MSLIDCLAIVFLVILIPLTQPSQGTGYKNKSRQLTIDVHGFSKVGSLAGIAEFPKEDGFPAFKADFYGEFPGNYFSDVLPFQEGGVGGFLVAVAEILAKIIISAASIPAGSFYILEP